MITDIKTLSSLELNWNDSGTNHNLLVATNTDNEDYISIILGGDQITVLPRRIIPELIKILEKHE